MNRQFIILVLACATLSSCGQEKTFDEKVMFSIQETVPLIMPADCTDRYVFLDARESEEYEVSHIKSAQWVGYEDFSMEGVKLSKHDTIVVYCSIGYRSEKIGEKLIDEGYLHVYNLYGGVFKWINDGNPVYIHGQETNRIHTYNKKWSKWVNKGEKIY